MVILKKGLWIEYISNGFDVTIYQESVKSASPLLLTESLYLNFEVIPSEWVHKCKLVWMWKKIDRKKNSVLYIGYPGCPLSKKKDLTRNSVYLVVSTQLKVGLRLVFEICCCFAYQWFMVSSFIKVICYTVLCEEVDDGWNFHPFPTLYTAVYQICMWLLL